MFDEVFEYTAGLDVRQIGKLAHTVLFFVDIGRQGTRLNSEKNCYAEKICQTVILPLIEFVEKFCRKS